MNTTAKKFMAAKGQPIEVDGYRVHSIYRRSVGDKEVVSGSFVYAASPPAQGIRIKVHGGMIIVNNQALPEAILWKETSPQDFTFECRSNKSMADLELRIWNCWRSQDEIVQAWIGNYGMIVDEKSDHVVLKCSPGTAEFDPLALVVRLKFDNPGNVGTEG